MHEMNKKNRQMAPERTKAEFAKGNHGILCVNGDDGYPYAIPVNYVYENDRVYIHSAKFGYKIDAIRRNSKVCFTAIIDSHIVQSKFTAAYKSVVVTGDISVVTDETTRRHVLEQYIYKLTPDFIENGMKFVDAAISKTELLQIDVIEMTGKENMAETLDA